VRPGRDLHLRDTLYARRQGINLNTVVSDALRRYLQRDDRAA
jgi:predicted HicB family RNase H-like nuclease